LVGRASRVRGWAVVVEGLPSGKGMLRVGRQARPRQQRPPLDATYRPASRPAFCWLASGEEHGLRGDVRGEAGVELGTHTHPHPPRLSKQISCRRRRGRGRSSGYPCCSTNWSGKTKEECVSNHNLKRDLGPILRRHGPGLRGDQGAINLSDPSLLLLVSLA
jgi:hypothetical protein